MNSNQLDYKLKIIPYSLGIIINPKPALLLTYSLLSSSKKRRKLLMPIREFNELEENLLDIDIDIMIKIVQKLKNRHYFLSTLENDLVLKVILILNGLLNQKELNESILNAENLLKTIDLNLVTDIQKPKIKQVRFNETRKEFFFEKYENELNEIDNNLKSAYEIEAQI